MAERIVNRRLTLLLLAAAAATLLVVLGFAQDSRDKAQNDGGERQRALQEAMRSEGLRGAARVTGSYVQTYDPFWHRPQLNLEDITRRSEIAVVGVALDNRCRLTKDGFIVLTVYDVLVQEVIKGDGVRAGDTIKVALPGGKVKFEDGTTAETTTPDFEKMHNGGRYTLYLDKRPPGDGDVYNNPNVIVYDLTGGPQGLFELPADGKVRSHARPTDTVAKETKDKDVSTFLVEARALAEKYPRPGK